MRTIEEIQKDIDAIYEDIDDLEGELAHCIHQLTEYQIELSETEEYTE